MESRSWWVKFGEYYACCRNKDGSWHALGSTSAWRAFKFACGMMYGNWRYRRNHPT